MKARFLLILFCLTTFTLFAQTDRYWVGGDGNWNDINHWAASSGGAGGQTVPNAITFRVIFDSNSGSPNVSVDLASFALQQVWITGNQAVSLTSSGAARTITIGDAVNNSITGASVTNADFVIESGSTLNIAGESGANTMTITQNNNANSQAIMVGTIQVNANGILTKAANPSFTFNSGATYIHNRDGGAVVTATWDAASNCNVTGITGVVPSGVSQTFGNFTWNASGQNATISFNVSATYNGTLRIQNTNGQVLNLASTGNRTLTVNNFLQDDGILSLSNVTANWGLLNISGTFTQNGGIITKSLNNAANEIRFSGATDVSPILNGTINSTGTNPLLFNINKTAPARVILPVNQTFDATVQLRVTTGTLDLGTTVSTVTVNGPFNLLAGGTIDMSTNADNILDLKSTVTYAAGGTLISGVNNQEVRYTGAAQNVMPLTYRNLLIDSTLTKTMVGAITVDNNLSIQGSATLLTNQYQIIGNATGQLTMASGTGLTLGSAGNAANILFPTNFIEANISLDAASTVTYQANTTQTISDVPTYGNLTLLTGTIKTLTGLESTVNIGGNLTITAGTFDLGATATAVNVSGTATITGTLNLGTTAKTTTIVGNTTIDGTLNFGTTIANTLTISGDLINLTGTITMQGVGLAHILNLGGVNNAISTFNTTAGSGSTVNYNRNGDQQVILSGNYRNLLISGDGVKTMGAGTTTVNDNLDINDATLAYNNGAARTLTITGNLSGNGTIDMSPGSFAHVLNLGGETNTIGTLTTAAVASVVNYNRTGDQTVFECANYRNLTISGSGTKTLQGDAVIGGNLSVSSTTASLNLGVIATNINVTGTATITGGLNFGGTTNKAVEIIGNFSMNNVASSVDMSGNTDHSLYLRGATNTYTAGGTFNSGIDNQTVYYYGDLNQNVMALNYQNLIISNYNAASVTNRTKTVSGIIIVGGDLTVDGYLNSLTTFQLGNFNFTVNGLTQVNDYGLLTDNAGQTNLFIEQVTISTNGRWNIAQPCTFRGGITVNSSNFTAGSTYTFDTNDQTIDGSQSYSLLNVATGTAGRTLTNANVNGVTITGGLSGSGNFTNGTATNNAILYVTAANPFTLSGVLDLNSYVNTVNYSGTVVQTIGAYNFYNLSSSSTGGRTLVNGGIIGIAGTFEPGTNTYTVTGNTVDFNGTGPQTIPVLRPATPIAYNNLTISGGSTKTLINPISIAGVLNISDGILELDDFNLTITNNAANAIQGSFSSSNMISTNGDGLLVKNAASLQTLYPLGSGGYYSPMTLTAVAPTTGTLSIRAVPTALNPSYILKYWDITSSVVRTSATATFQYDPAEENGALPSISYSPDNGATWQNPPTNGVSSFGSNSFTITGTNPFAGWWTMGYKTYYSYQTGDWDTPSTWTSDPSGTLQIGNTLPGYNDKVVILSGRTVSLSSNISTQNIDLTINEGGFLDLTDKAFDFMLLALRGQGTLKLASANFPTATTNTFVNAGGGTVEYNANINLPVVQTTYNNLAINTTGVVVQLNNLTLNGNLVVSQGTFQINDNTPTQRRLTINGNVSVEAAAGISVGTGVTNTTTNPSSIAAGGTAPFINYFDQQSHRVVIYGDFTNEGTVKFTNLSFPIYDMLPPLVDDGTTGFATVYFMGSTDNTLTCDGTTDFYNLVIDKGTDQTYKLTISSTDYANFRLFGANTSAGENPGINPYIRKALWIRTGTLVLDGLLVIPSLTEGTDGVSNPNSDYFIPANAALTLNNENVVILVTADDYQDVNAAYGTSGGSGLVNGVSQGGFSSLQVYGKLTINNGYVSTRESSGILYSAVNSGQIFINGGTVDAKQFRAIGAGLIAYNQSGGTVLLRGRMQRTPTLYNSVSDLINAPVNPVRSNEGTLDLTSATYSINNTSDVFSMSSGTIRIYDVTDPAAGEAFEMLTSAANYSVTGGTVEFVPIAGSVTADAATWLISSNSSLGNVTVNRISSSTVVRVNTGYPLTVLKNVSLQSGELDANSLDLTIGGNFSISSGTTYTQGTNTTIFNGSGTQTFTVNLAAALSLNKLNINKSAGHLLNFAGTQKTINIADDFWLYEGTMNDNGNTINIVGDLYNSGVHTGTGKIVLNSDDAQVIDGDGTGVFRYLELNKPTDGSITVIVNNDFTINNTLDFTGSAAGYKSLNLQTWKLTLGASANIVGYDANRYILTSGNFGDGGIKKTYNASNTSFVFPLGVTSYTPATISITSAPTTWGSITVVTVNSEHPNTTTKNISLQYYWKVRSSGFTGLAAGSISHSYIYDETDILGNETDYIPARYQQSDFSWTSGTTASINTTTNTIGAPWLSNTNNIDGEYTAGDAAPTNPFGSPTIYYSRQTGLWSDVNTWSLTNTNNHNPVDNPVAGSVPGASNIVVIGGNDSVFLATDVTWPYTTADVDPRSCASLKIELGSALDVGYNPTSNLGTVLNHTNGNGNFRFTTSSADQSTYVFPGGDFSEFNVNLGTTEIYSTNPNAGTTYWLPNNISSYGNLIISPLGGSNIIFGNTNLIIYGNLVMRGQNSLSWFCPTWGEGGYSGSIQAKTITIDGDMRIEGGALIWIGNDNIAQDIVVNGDVFVDEPAGIGASTFYGTPTNQSLSIGGDLINNSLAPAASPNTYRGCDLNLIPTTFIGSTNASITNTNTLQTPYTRFNQVTVNKGTSQSTTLTINIGGTLTTPTNNWLTLQNGTLRYMRNNPSSNFTISTGAFTIPATAGLYLDYNNAVNILIGNLNNDNSDLFLNGKLTLVNGNVFIGRVGGADVNNNDIEYSGGGSSALDIRGGTLFVNGQIRRNPSSSAGILNYSQSGGTVTINGQNATTTNAKLEIVNTGSVFNMSGTSNIIIVRGGGGATYGDLYLRPASSTVTGGTILLQPINNISAAAENFIIDADASIFNLTINGFDANDRAFASLKVNPLTVKGDLIINNANTSLTSNNLNLTIGGNFTNDGTYTYGTNTTIFNGGTQQILGATVTNFYNLTSAPVSSLTVNNSFTVNGSLNITSGNLSLTNRNLTLLGNLTNNGSYTDDNSATAGVRLSGTTQQQLSGTGAFGRLELNNNAGGKILNDLTLQNDFVLTAGNLDISQYQFTLSQNSALSGAPFGLTKMIISDGVASSLGFRKFFNAAPATFTFPVGVNGKYTPVDLVIDANATVGYININPINNNHPAVEDPLNVLKYYWEVESSGISEFEGSFLMHYLSGDVQGPESDYVAAKLLTPGTYWSKATPGPATDNVDEVLHQITFPVVAGTNDLTGDYTAGTDAALPDEVPSYITNNDGNWTDNTIWDPIGASPPCPVGGPNGFNVVIDTDHEVATNANYCFAYNTTIYGELRVISPTFGHNLGNVEGDGTLYLETGNLPAGNFDTFLDCDLGGGTLEYGGSGNYTILATQFSTVPNLFFTGSGTRTLPNKDLTICNRLVIDGPTLDNNTNDRKLTIKGTIERYNTGAFLAGAGANAIVSFAGTTAQVVGGALGNFTGTNRFYSLEISNSTGLSIGNGGSIELLGYLYLTEGTITTTSTNKLSILNSVIAAAIPSDGTSTSYINGPLVKRIDPGSNFLYPLGRGTTKGHTFTVSSTSASPLLWTSEFFTPNSTATALTAPLEASNSDEYWSVSTSTATTARVKIAWDPTSALTPLMTVNGISDMRVAEYDTGTSSWVEQASTTTGDVDNGDVATSGNVSISTTAKNYTSASITTTKPRASFNPTGPVCGAAGIPFRITTFYPINPTYKLFYTENGTPRELTTSSLTGTIPTPVAGSYQLTGFTYDTGAETGVVSSTIVITYDIPTTANAGVDTSLCGLSGITLYGNDPSPFSGLWTIRSGAGGILLSPTSYNSVFTGVSGINYTLRWTISSGGCTSYDDINISFPVAPQKPGSFTSAPNPVCQGGSGYVYRVPSVPNTTYNWSYSGTGANINGLGNPVNGIGNSVTISFNASATSGVLSVTATNSCGTSTARTVSITVNPLPDAAGTITGSPEVCQGENGVGFSVGAIANATGYSWSLPSGASIASGVNTNSITVDFDASAVSGNITVVGTNSCGSGVISPNYAVTVHVPPTISLGPNPSVCQGISPANLTYSGTTQSPDLYSIDFDLVAEGEDFVDIFEASLAGSPISIVVPLDADDGTYNAILTVKNNATNCVSQSYNIQIIVLPLPTSVVVGLSSGSPICDGDPAQIELVITGQPPFDFTVQDDQGNSWNIVNLNVASGSTYYYDIPTNPIWLGPSVSTTYVYTTTNLVDDNGCNEAAPSGSATVIVYKIPTTGPHYHIPNNFGL